MKKLAILACLLLLVACVPSRSQVATPTPTVVPSPTLVPTNTPGPMPGVAFGTRENPVLRGQSCLAPSGWQIVVLDFNPDAWPVVQAASTSNQPPRFPAMTPAFYFCISTPRMSTSSSQ